MAMLGMNCVRTLQSANRSRFPRSTECDMVFTPRIVNTAYSYLISLRVGIDPFTTRDHFEKVSLTIAQAAEPFHRIYHSVQNYIATPARFICSLRYAYACRRRGLMPSLAFFSVQKSGEYYPKVSFIGKNSKSLKHGRSARVLRLSDSKSRKGE